MSERESASEGNEREIERGREGGKGVPGINHNYNQRAPKLHQGDPLWPPRLAAPPASHENLSSNFGFLQGRPRHFAYIALPLFREFAWGEGGKSTRSASPATRARPLAEERAAKKNKRRKHPVNSGRILYLVLMNCTARATTLPRILAALCRSCLQNCIVARISFLLRLSRIALKYRDDIRA